MEITAFEQIFTSLDAAYIVLCNIITYVIVTSIESIVKHTIQRGWKRLISSVSALILGAFMFLFLDHEVEGLFYGFFIQFLTWDYLFKGWINKLSKNNVKDVPAGTPVIEERTEVKD